MHLTSIGHRVRQRRRQKRLTVAELAASAGVGRSTLAALEAGRLSELGFVKVARICAAVGLVLEARPLELDAPLMPHRHLTDVAGRDLTKAAGNRCRHGVREKLPPSLDDFEKLPAMRQQLDGMKQACCHFVPSPRSFLIRLKFRNEML